MDRFELDRDPSASNGPPVTIHGRGAAHNPANRFEQLSVEREAWTHAEDPAPETHFYRDLSRSIIATNNSPDVGFEASINPYRGCENGCCYCMHGSTAVLMADGTTRLLSDLRIGDEIYGTLPHGWYRRLTRTRVKAHWEVEKPAYRILLEDGTELVASGEHRFLTMQGWKFVTGGGRDVIPHLKTSDRLVGIGGLAQPPCKNQDYSCGYLCGMIRGDGLLRSYAYDRKGRKHGNQHQFRLALVDEPALRRTAKYLNAFGVETHFYMFQSATARTKQLNAIRSHAGASVRRIRDIISWPWYPSSDWSCGFLAGIFDAEGSYSGSLLRISNTDSAIVAETQKALCRLGFIYTLSRHCDARSRPLSVIGVLGGLREHMRFFHTVDPAISRKRDLEGHSIASTANLGVIWIEPVGRTTLFDITTGTGDFIADGAVSHNCYARPTHEFFGLSAGLDFETKIFAKEDAPELLRRELTSPRWEPKVLAMSGVTDPYQPVERRLRITRRCLEVLAELRNPVAIITKSHMVTRDIDLLGELARHGAAAVNLSITTLRRDLQRVMEPRTSIPERRLEAIRKVSEAGIPTGVLVAPVIPGLTDHEMPRILERAAEAGAVRAGYVLLRLPYAVEELFENWLERHFPDRKDKVLNRLRSLRGGALNDSRFGVRMRGEGPFAEQIRRMFEVGCRKAGLNQVSLELSTAAFRRPRAENQLGLFEES